MTDKKNLVVPVHPFAWKPLNLFEHLGDALNMRNYAVSEALLCLIDFNETERIYELDAPIGYTLPFSYSVLAKRTGMSRRSAIRAVKELKDKKAIEKEEVTISDATGVRKVNRVRFKFFDAILQELRDNPDHPKHKFVAIRTGTVEMESLTDDDTSDESSSSDKNGGDSEKDGRDELTPNQESLDSKGPPGLTGLGTSEKEGGDLNSQKRKTETADPPSHPESREEPKTSQRENDANLFLSEPSEAEPGFFTETDTKAADDQQRNKLIVHSPVSSKHSSAPAAALDIVPNGQIGKIVDDLAKGMAMNAAATDESIEDFITVFKPQSGVVSTWEDQQKASLLKESIEKKLNEASISMPPLLFFKHCMKEVDKRISSGEMRERPKHLTFFAKTPTGEDIIARCIANLRSEKKAVDSKVKTDTWLQDQQQRRDAPREMTAETKAKMDQLLGRA